MKPFGYTSGVWVLGLTLLGVTGVSCATHRNTVLIKGKELLHEHQAETSTSKAPEAATQAEIKVTYAKLPLHFEPNQGQTDEQVHFLSRGSGYTLFLASMEAVLVLRKPPEKSPGRTLEKSLR